MMRLVPFEAQHFIDVDWQDSQRPWAHLTTSEVANAWVEAGDGLTLLDDDGDVIATAGVAPTLLNVFADGTTQAVQSHAFAAFSPRFSAHIKLILRAIRGFLNDRPETKIYMQVWPADTKAARFARRLGFVFERAAYEDAIGAFVHIYARVRH